MFIQRVISKGKKGQTYQSVLVRSTHRDGKKVVAKTLAILSHLPDWLIRLIEKAIKRGEPIESLDQLAGANDGDFDLKVAESFGAHHVVLEVARAAGIPQALGALGSDAVAKLVLWQVLARVLAPAVSLLGMVRMVAGSVATMVLGIKNAFTEDDLYGTGAWVVEHQARIETHLFTKHMPDLPQSEAGLFYYDVTSSYFEGLHNDLSAFGYNRDKIKGKKQVVMGLLTDSSGEPISTQLFPGNTNDLATFKDQIDALKVRFEQKNVTMVGDRGMIRGPQQQQVNEAGMHYISALHKCEIETLLKAGTLQMGLFDNAVHETKLADGRRLVTRCNPQRREELAATHTGFKQRMEAWVEQANLYLKEHPKAKVATQLKAGLERLKKGKLHVWMKLEEKEGQLKLTENKAAYDEHTKLDGCYAIVSDLAASEASAQQLHDRYKALSNVEAGFRTLKHGHLEIRPWYVRKEENTRAHAFTAMLALKIRRRLQAAWEPLNITVEEGLATLSQLCVMELIEKKSQQCVTRLLPKPSEIQTKLLAAVKVTLPIKAPEKGVDVATRVKLETRRKSASKA
jgi:transposase